MTTASSATTGGGKDLPTPSSTPTTSRKSRRRSNLFTPSSKNKDDKDKDKHGKNGALLVQGELGIGRAIPIKQVSGRFSVGGSVPVAASWLPDCPDPALENLGSLGNRSSSWDARIPDTESVARLGILSSLPNCRTRPCRGLVPLVGGPTAGVSRSPSRVCREPGECGKTSLVSGALWYTKPNPSTSVLTLFARCRVGQWNTCRKSISSLLLWWLTLACVSVAGLPLQAVAQSAQQGLEEEVRHAVRRRQAHLPLEFTRT